MNSPSLRLLSAADQTAGHLRAGIAAGRWKQHLPGFSKLAGELGVSRNTTMAAVARLIDEGLLAPADGRRPHRILDGTKSASVGPRRLRTALLTMVALEKFPANDQRSILSIMAELKVSGHECVPVTFPAGKDTHKTGLLPRLVANIEADAWLVVGGTAEILRWFAESGRPVLAVGGASKSLPIAGASAYDRGTVIRSVTRRLLELGHRRITLICRHESRLPAPRTMVLSFREELQAAGIKPGEFNTPDWEESSEGLDALLKSLFRFTPPTALIGVDVPVVTGALGFAGRMGIAVPRDLSIVSLTLSDTLPEWAFPGVRHAHVECDESPWLRRIREWVRHVACDRKDTRQFTGTAHLVEGNTMGAAKQDCP